MRCGSFYCELWQGFYPFLLPRRLRDQYCAPRLPQFSAMCFKINWNCAKRTKSIGWGRVKLVSQISGYYCLFLGQNSLSSRSLLSLRWWRVRIQRCQCKTLSCTGLSGGTWATSTWQMLLLLLNALQEGDTMSSDKDGAKTASFLCRRI